MKIRTVYKVTNSACQSCLMSYPKTPLEVKNFLTLSYSTNSWTLPNIKLPDSGIFVFTELENARKFVKTNAGCLDDNYIIWEAIGVNVRQKRNWIALGSGRTVDQIKNFWGNFWNLLAGVKLQGSGRRHGYHIADAVKLTKIVS